MSGIKLVSSSKVGEGARVIWYFTAGALAVALAALSRAQNRANATKAALISVGGPSATHAEPADLDFSADRKWNLFDWAAIAVLVGFAASRLEVGTDWEMYFRFYQSIQPEYFPLSFWLDLIPQDAGFVTMEVALKSVWSSPYGVFWVASILAIAPTYAVMKRFTTSLPMSVFFFVTLGFWVAPFNIVRQGIAMGLNFWAASRLDRSKRLFVVVNAVAGTIHATAWVAATIQLLTGRIRLSLKSAAVILAGAVAAAAALASFSFLGGQLAALNPRYEASLLVDQAGIGTYLVIVVRLVLLAFVARRGLKEEQQSWFTWSVIGAVFLILGTQSMVLSRMDFYFGIFLVLLLPAQMRKENRPGLNALIYIGAAVYLGMYLQKYGGLLPYQTYLSY